MGHICKIFKQGNGKLTFALKGSLLLVRMDWSRERREDGDWLGGDCSNPGERWMDKFPPRAIW